MLSPLDWCLTPKMVLSPLKQCSMTELLLSSPKWCSIPKPALRLQSGAQVAKTVLGP